MQPDVHFRTTGMHFRLIDDRSRHSVFVRYRNRNSTDIGLLSRNGPSKDILRRLQRYSVSLSNHAKDQLEKSRQINEIWPGFWLWIGTYNETTGLPLFSSDIEPADLVIWTMTRWNMKGFCLQVKGSFACFTRPEMKVERVSYDVMTPSSARAIFDAILWKPGMCWVIKKIGRR